MGRTIRRLTHRDSQLAMDAIRTLKPTYERGNAPCLLDAVRSFLASPANLLVVASEDSQPVGYAVAYLLQRADRPAPMMLLYELAVSERSQRRGIGAQMLALLQQTAATAGAFKLWVLTNPANQAATGLYTASGAAIVGENALYVWEPPESWAS